ncbi:MAG TPA: ABC transporter ATP-binding protein, partial [Bacteroidia bacterium]|nr:ABC transporter ATP-binding protein [Bacteroidia bacterium]
MKKPESANLAAGQSGVLLEVRNLVTEFRTENETIRAVNDISFTIHAGETIGIVGESGSGKSVTALSTIGLVPNPPGKITGGELLYTSREDGLVDLTKVSEKKMRKYRGNEIAMIFQEPMTSLNPVYSCGDQVAEAILLHKDFPGISDLKDTAQIVLRWLYRIVNALLPVFGLVAALSGPDPGSSTPEQIARDQYSDTVIYSIILVFYATLGIIGWRRKMKGNRKPLQFYTSREKIAREMTLRLFEQVQLPDPERIYEAYPHAVSGGQKQRVMIAMAMSCNPQLLIADEPTTALDVTVQKTILDLMRDLQASHNMSIMFITHDLGVIAELADRIVVMYKGKIVEQGSVLEIFSN